jgi:serine/threonine protein kinase
VPELRLENSVVDERYLVERCLGRGSYAEIFLAFDQRFEDRVVIIKALNTSLQGTPDPDLEQTLVENFQNEAIALDRVRHPHIIQRLGHGTAADLEGVPFHYLVLEYMPGGDLWALCRTRPIGFEDALFYFQQVAEALAYAHKARIIHRDIKPNNILLSADRRVLKIADFGVAKMTHDEASEITRVGTNVYAPPEHHPDVIVDEQNEKLTPSADVYSLAKTIYTAMTGRAPRQFSREPIRDLPSELSSETWSTALLEVFRKATASRVADRYQTVEEFWSSFVQVRFGASDQEADDEATIVRSRLSTTSSVEQVAARPNFQTLTHNPRLMSRSQKARIIVELPGQPDVEKIRDEGAEQGTDLSDSPQTDREDDERAAAITQQFGSAAPNGSQTRAKDYRDGISLVAGNRADVLNVRKPTPNVLRKNRGLLGKMRSVITSEWLRRVFIIFLAAALIGLAVSTYYHFADQKSGFTIFGPTKDGRIANAPNVNLRSEPFGSVLIALPEKTRVRVTEERNGWLRVRILEWVGGAPDNAPEIGWVDGRFVKMD